MKKALLLLLICGGFHAYGQQQAMFSQYMFNPIAINPAYAGSSGGLTATALSRFQWTSLEGAPKTQTFSIHGPVKYSKASFGAQLYHDQITVSNYYGIYGFYSYYIAVSENVKLSFGLRAGASYFQADMSDLDLYYPEMDFVGDPVFMSSSYGGWLPNVGAGLYLFSKRSYLGFSMPEMINNTIETSVESLNARQSVHYFVHGGHVMDLSPSLKLKPNFLVKSVKGASVQVDLNANMLIRDIVWVGVSYRWEESFAALFEIDFTRQWRIGYSYDIPKGNDLGPFHNGSHEFMLSYRFLKNNNMTITPRYF
jgi:type IX secretion system PorP/SprF family membrane protein